MIKEKARATFFDADKQELKSVKEILTRTKEIQEIYVPALGCKVKVGHVSMKEWLEIQALNLDEKQIGFEMTFRLLRNADPKVTKEEVLELPFQVVTSIMEQIVHGGLGFPKALRPQKPT
jgi:hypothetical protein